MKKRLPREERFPTKTDIKGIKRWLNKSNEIKKTDCPFERYEPSSHWPHWKCTLIFHTLIRKRNKDMKKRGWCGMCPCDYYTLNHIEKTAKNLIKRYEHGKNR